MCRITRGMMRRATDRLARNGTLHSSSGRGEFIIRTHYDGREYSQKITSQQIREAYARAINC